MNTLVTFCRGILLLIALAFVTSGALQAQTELRTRTVTTGLDTPWEIQWGPDSWIWITERYGRISRVHPQTGEVQVLALITEVRETEEGGLLGMTFHPNFTTTPHVFVAYTYVWRRGGLEWD